MEQTLLPGRWPNSPSVPISFADAMSIVAAQAAAILAEPMGKSLPFDLADALGHVLAGALTADRDQPPFPRVTRDGFALRAQDLAPGTRLRVTGQLRAGEPWGARPDLLTGEAVEIMTGAALPPGADAVFMVEHAEVDGSGGTIVAYADRTIRAGENVVPQGSEARRGDVLVEAGTRLRPEEIALAAACGLRSVQVFAPVPVAILATGDELVEPAAANGETTIAQHQIYDSNSYSLAALVRQTGNIPLRQRAAPDRKEELTASIQAALQTAPLLLLSGGVSMGRYDLVEEVLAGLGAEFFFAGVKMQPGKPVVFGRVPAPDGLSSRYFFGLPGNPVSTMVTFRVFVQPLLAALSGERHWQPHIALAKLAADVRGKPGLRRFLPAHFDTAQPEPIAVPLGNQGSGDLAANVRANCYVIVPEDREFLHAGETARILLG